MNIYIDDLTLRRKEERKAEKVLSLFVHEYGEGDNLFDPS